MYRKHGSIIYEDYKPKAKRSFNNDHKTNYCYEWFVSAM